MINWLWSSFSKIPFAKRHGKDLKAFNELICSKFWKMRIFKGSHCQRIMTSWVETRQPQAAQAQLRITRARFWRSISTPMKISEAWNTLEAFLMFSAITKIRTPQKISKKAFWPKWPFRIHSKGCSFCQINPQKWRQNSWKLVKISPKTKV